MKKLSYTHILIFGKLNNQILERSNYPAYSGYAGSCHRLIASGWRCVEANKEVNTRILYTQRIKEQSIKEVNTRILYTQRIKKTVNLKGKYAC